MTDYPALTIIDVIYSILEDSDRPLTPLDIQTFAAEAGYDVPAWEAIEEIEAHLDAYGHISPFVQVGRQKYWVYFEPEIYTPPIRSPSFHFPIWTVMTLLAISGIGFLLYFGSGFIQKPEDKQALSSGAEPVQSQVFLPNLAQTSIQVPAQVAAITIDPDWWSQNAVNQINRETQAVSRAYLSNYYNTCGPAVISMVVSFYRSQPGGDGSRVTPADVLRAARAQLGYFYPPYNSGLMVFENLDAILALYELERANPEGKGNLLSLEDLLQGVRQGYPAIVGMRYGYQNGRYVPVGGSGIYDHFVVVFGTQQVDGQEYVLVLNNHPGNYLIEDADVQPERMSLEQFQRSWLLNDGTDNQNYGYAAFYKPIH